MANLTPDGVLDPAGAAQPTGFLHPILLAFLNSLPNPNIVITQHPAFPILMTTHPQVQAAASPAGTGFTAETPGASLTSGTGIATAGAAPRVASTATSGMTIGNPTTGLTANTPGSSGGLPTVNPVGTAPTTGGPQSQAPTPGVPNPAAVQSPVQPLPPVVSPNGTKPVGNTSQIGPRGIPGIIEGREWWHSRPGVTQNPAPPISAAQAAAESGVVAGPAAINHVPYGPELTGLSQYGGLITPNGTPVAMSAWQKMMLDPTSIARYNSYVSDVAGMNPADLAQIGQAETANKMADLKAPIRFSGFADQMPAPAGG